MKSTVASLLGAAALAAALPAAATASELPAAPQQGRGNGHGNGHDASHNRSPRAQERSQSWHKFTKGEKFDRSRAEFYVRLEFGSHRRLRRPPPGHVWVRSGTDALLVRIVDNIVMDVVDSLF